MDQPPFLLTQNRCKPWLLSILPFQPLRRLRGSLSPTFFGQTATSPIMYCFFPRSSFLKCGGFACPEIATSSRMSTVCAHFLFPFPTPSRTPDFPLAVRLTFSESECLAVAAPSLSTSSRLVHIKLSFSRALLLPPKRKACLDQSVDFFQPFVLFG